jgi:hypothetical protein
MVGNGTIESLAFRPDSFYVDQQLELVAAHVVAIDRAKKPVCTENLIRVDAVMESPKLAE